ncbi:protein of unknown function [Mesobacillus persicus]|uniref:DUF4349 domain-containing protein n=1 Tax=Mesobacillus persicus TaxID=930146 RepID=A0A1H8FKL5_9BACI|nr:DUF4349 domain-containing protein [Mesobacillus persicus]SEN32130.1 protein of unknown function [Mesobacillus persicus]
MRTRRWLCLSIIIVGLFLYGCSGQQDAEYSQSEEIGGTEEKVSEDRSLSLTDSQLENGTEQQDVGEQPQDQAGETMTNSTERMVIYNAELHLRVKNFSNAQKELEKRAIEYGGYLVESSTNRYENEQLSGMMTFRIPQKQFSTFLHDAENVAADVTNRHVSGQDVTEEYVDLESRHRSKKAVEARLLSFMEDAEKTEDLLKISSELAKVQVEIEQLTGRMKYLENQTSFSTVTVSMEETDILVPGIDNENLNTWQKVKKQLVANLNFLLSFFSGLIVVIAGNLPILLIIGMVFGTFLWFLKKRKRKYKE